MRSWCWSCALVGGSGEFFCNHAKGGYGAEPGISLAELGAGERMMDTALLKIDFLLGKFPKDRR